MTQRQKLFLMAAVVISLSFAGLAAAQNASITVQVNTGNQPAGGVSIFVLASGNKFSQGTPPTGTTDSAGTFAFPPGLLSSSKPHAQMEVYEVCVNGQKVLFIIPKGSEDQLPPDTNDCKKRRIGGFYWDDGSSVVVNLAPGGGVTQTGGRPTGGVEMGGPVRFEVSAYGGVGFIKDNRVAKVLGDGAVLIPVGPLSVGAEIGVERIPSSTVSMLGNTSGGPTGSTFVISAAGMTNFRAGGRVEVRAGGFGFDVDGGALVADLKITSTSGFCGGSLGTSCSVISNSQIHDTDIGSYVGAHVSHSLVRYVDVVVGWSYDRVNDGSKANVHVNEVFGGLRIRFGGSK